LRDRGDRFPPPASWEQAADVVGTEKPASNQGDKVFGSHVPTVPAKNREGAQCKAADAWAAWEERAAILEYDGGLDRIEAEARSQQG